MIQLVSILIKVKLDAVVSTFENIDHKSAKGIN